MSSGRFIPRERVEKATEIFRNKLEESGVLEAITKALAELNSQKDFPESPMAFVIQELTGALPGSIVDMSIKGAHELGLRDRERLQRQVQKLEKDNAALRRKLEEGKGGKGLEEAGNNDVKREKITSVKEEEEDEEAEGGVDAK